MPLATFGPDRGGLWAASVLWAVLSGLTPFFMWRLTLILLTPAAAAPHRGVHRAWPLHITSAGYFLSETPSLTFLVASLATGTSLTARPAVRRSRSLLSPASPAPPR